MCTIVVLHGVHPRHPIAVIANRDEVRDRASSPPRVLIESPRAIGGLDVASGGTWMGANDRGVFAGVTNQRTLEPPDRSKRSRGEVVMRALSAQSTDDVASQLGAIDARDYNPFNLIFGAVGDVRVAYARAEHRQIEIEAVPPGIAVLANDRLCSAEFPKIIRAEERARAALGSLERDLLGVLSDHELPSVATDRSPSRFPPEIVASLQALCIHLPFYGTVSATAMLFDRAGRLERYLFADGPPCTTPFRDVTGLFAEDHRTGARNR